MNQTSPQIIKRSEYFNLFIEEVAKKKILRACQEVWNDEWSGILFYNTEGNFQDGSLLIKVKDIYIMDIGNQTYTEFDMSPEVISYMQEKELIGCYTGLIHSHNNMSTFFSGTDINTLQAEALDTNHFVSLIVNNKGEYSAAITRKGVAKQEIKNNITYRTFNDEVVNTEENHVEELQFLEWFPLRLVTSEKDINLSREIHERLEHLRTKNQKNSKKEFNKGYKQTSFAFTEENNPYSENLRGFAEVEIPKQGYSVPNTTACDTKLLKSLLLQLLTGSIIISDSSSLDIKKWASKMPKMFERRFGTTDLSFKCFTIWAEDHIGFLCSFIDDPNLNATDLDEDEIASLYAESLIKELKNLPQNKYINYYIETLKKYII